MVYILKEITKDSLYYIEGLTKLFMDYGNYENKNKARVRYMVDELWKKLSYKNSKFMFLQKNISKY